MLGVLIVEREPLQVAGLPAAFQTWVLIAGAFAGIALLVWLVVYVFRGSSPAFAASEEQQTWGSWLLSSLVGGAALAIAAAGMPWLWSVLGWGTIPGAEKFRQSPLRNLLTAKGSASTVLWLFLASVALAAVTVPVLRNLRRLRWRRIWAIAKLSIKEAVRSRILWTFSFLLLIFLFGSWFLPSKPEYQVRSYVQTVFVAMTVLLLIPAGMLAALSIPTDLRQQTIHTVVTKPVEKFEIVLGRVFGYTLLMTCVLAVMTFLSLIYVRRGVDEEAANESLRARVPIFGDLEVRNGKSVGREWEYRSYIGVSTQHKSQAIWTFPRLPADFGRRTQPVRLEYEFNIFRTTKGDVEGEPILCSFTFKTARWDDAKLDEYHRRRDQELLGANRLSSQNIDERLAKEYGYYEIRDKTVVDFHTLAVNIPPSLFQSLSTDLPANQARPALTIVVECQSRKQYLGVAKHDLYLLDHERPVWLNFFKGAAGIWFLLCLVIGVAVTCSTNLSGIISFLATLVLLLSGLWLPFIKDLALRKIDTGGPAESIIRLSRPDLAITQPLDKTPVAYVAKAMDNLFSMGLRLIQPAFPTVERFGLTEYVARGFDISAEQLLCDDLLPLAAYLYLWVILAYYLMKLREVAS